MPSKGSDQLTGIILILAGIIVGVVVVAGLYQWGSTVQADTVAALATPTMSVPIPGDQGAPVPGSASGAAASSPVAGASSAVGDAAAGQTVFAANCTACHPNGGAGMGPALKGLSDDRISQVTRQGKGIMPAFPASRLSDQQLADILAYLK